MLGTRHKRVRAVAPTVVRPRVRPQTALQQADLPTIARYMFWLMLRNVSSDGFRIEDPNNPNSYSAPGCVIAAPSLPANPPGIDQDYVFNWTRDAAITAMEIAAAAMPARNGGGVQPLIDYVTFAKICQDHAQPTLAHACFTIEGDARQPWTEQSDGPALQTLALLQALPQLDDATKRTASTVIGTNLAYLSAHYQEPTTNLWEEQQGLSFFAQAVQLRCFNEIKANTYGINVPPEINDALLASLQTALDKHWNGEYYATLLAPPWPGDPAQPAVPPNQNYDPNIDIVCASIYGSIPCTDTKLLATAALLRRQWEDDTSPTRYPINDADRTIGIGPLLGRYPGDVYDGDMNHPVPGGHPWPVCTCNFAELYYRLANAIDSGTLVRFDDPVSKLFFEQITVNGGTSPANAVAALRDAGDKMLRAVIYHSDGLELSEQFDGNTGFEKSVRDLTWSYAAFLSAVRAR